MEDNNIYNILSSEYGKNGLRANNNRFGKY